MAAWLAAGLAAGMIGCGGSNQPNAPLAPQSFTNSVHTTAADSGSAGGFVFDAGAPPDSGAMVCRPGAFSVPYSTQDPCDQVTSSCTLMGSTAVSTCQPDGTWGLPCVCQSLLGGGVGGAGAGMIGSGGTFF